jgi:hypothetical protein
MPGRSGGKDRCSMLQPNRAQEHSFRAVGYIVREIREAKTYLIGVYLEDKDADAIIAELDDLRSRVLACRKHPVPPP